MILVTGGSGMLGSSFDNNKNIIKLSSKDCDLTNREETLKLFNKLKPEFVVHLAAKVGGVKANSNFMADFYLDNIKINTNVLEASYLFNVKKVVSLLSTCVYPDTVRYPLTEGQVHDGTPHHTNFGYAYAKRMLDVQSRAFRQQHGCNFITAIPNNLFGKNDNFDLENSHVIPALIRKVYEAKIDKKTSVTFWGDGSPLREFTYAKDISDILMFLLENYNDSKPINIGNTGEISIKHLSEQIIKIFDYTGDIVWDKTKPSGQYRKPSSNEKLINLGYNTYTNFDKSLKQTCEWFINNYPNIRGIR